MSSAPADSKAAPATADCLSAPLLALLVDHINVGILTVSPDATVLQWNRFLEAHTRLPAQEVIGRNLYERFPDLPRAWLERKLQSVFLLKNFAFTSWKQRPYLFRLEGHRPLSSGVEAMRQDCAFFPLLHDGCVKAISVVIIDATEAYESQTRLDETLAVLAAQSERDGLTGIFNRRKLEEVLAVEILRARRYKQKLGLMMFDIDHFKKVNDTYGHLVGDEAIRHVATTALATLRATDVVARYGGEEFVAVLPGEDFEGAVLAAERVRAAVRKPFKALFDVRLSVTISIGVTSFRPDVADAKTLIGEADQALYASKQGGRDRVTLFEAPRPAVVGG
jgi:diguanylate cyclase (GGDEF)-like protein